MSPNPLLYLLMVVFRTDWPYCLPSVNTFLDYLFTMYALRLDFLYLFDILFITALYSKHSLYINLYIHQS